MSNEVSGAAPGREGAAQVRYVHDEQLDRVVAEKVLSDRVDDSDVVRRFAREARMTARLEHPNITPVYAYGVNDRGAPWFTMRHVDGDRLSDLLVGDPRARKPHELHTRLENFLKVCDAVVYAHDRGVVHRDLKPQNVVVRERYGEVYLLDWGSGVLVGGERDPQGVFYGTPAYAAPEQARGDNHLIDFRTDVFGLGAILYQVLTHRPPYTGRTRREVWGYACAAAVLPPDLVENVGPLPRELVDICLRALSFNPDDRHQSAQELRDEVQSFVRSGWRFETRRFAARSTIVVEGEIGKEAFILQSGRCRVEKTVGGSCTILRELGPGDVFGETGAVTGLPRTATIRAMEDVEVAVISFDDLKSRLGLDSWSGKIVRTLADRFRDVDAERTLLQRRIADTEIASRALVAIARGGGAPLAWSRWRAQTASELDREENDLEQAVRRSTLLDVDDARDELRAAAPQPTGPVFHPRQSPRR